MRCFEINDSSYVSHDKIFDLVYRINAVKSDSLETHFHVVLSSSNLDSLSL